MYVRVLQTFLIKHTNESTLPTLVHILNYNYIVPLLLNYLPSTSMPLGTKGTKLVAMIISFAVTMLDDPTLTLCGT